MKSKTSGWRRCAAAGLAAGVFFVAGCGKQDAELAVARQKELEVVRAELEQVKASAAAQEAELTRLRKDNLELLRLRNEVRQLRDDKKQLSQEAQTAQAQAQQAQAQAQAIQSQAQQAVQALTAQQRATAQQQQALACINNLRQIDGAKQQWALERRKPAEALPTVNDVAAYLKGGLPKCPAGGTYTLNAVGIVPTCSIPGHALPQ